MRKQIAQVQPYLPIVGITLHRLRVLFSKRPNASQLAQLNVHARIIRPTPARVSYSNGLFRKKSEVNAVDLRPNWSISSVLNCDLLRMSIFARIANLLILAAALSSRAD